MDNLPIHKKTNESNLNSPNTVTLNVLKKPRQKKLFLNNLTQKKKNRIPIFHIVIIDKIL